LIEVLSSVCSLPRKGFDHCRQAAKSLSAAIWLPVRFSASDIVNSSSAIAQTVAKSRFHSFPLFANLLFPFVLRGKASRAFDTARRTMKQIILTDGRRSYPRVVDITIALSLIAVLSFLRVGAAEITAMAILLRELRQWTR
jgi:hypothetical protein